MSGVDTTYYRVNKSHLKVYNNPITMSEDGTYSIEYFSTDLAGNAETANMAELFIFIKHHHIMKFW